LIFFPSLIFHHSRFITHIPSHSITSLSSLPPLPPLAGRKYIEAKHNESANNSKRIIPFEFVMVFSLKYIKDLKNVIEGLTHESEETPQCRLRCEVINWGTPGRSDRHKLPSLQNLKNAVFRSKKTNRMKLVNASRCCCCSERRDCLSILFNSCCGFFNYCFCNKLSKKETKLYLLIDATPDTFVHWAEQMGLKHSRRTSTNREEFKSAMADKFEPFRSLERQQIL